MILSFFPTFSVLLFWISSLPLISTRTISRWMMWLVWFLRKDNGNKCFFINSRKDNAKPEEKYRWLALAWFFINSQRNRQNLLESNLVWVDFRERMRCIIRGYKGKTNLVNNPTLYVWIFSKSFLWQKQYESWNIFTIFKSSNLICLKFDSQTCFRGSSVLSKVNMAIHMWLNT